MLLDTEDSLTATVDTYSMESSCDSYTTHATVGLLI
jgi:hypothetical protein